VASRSAASASGLPMMRRRVSPRSRTVKQKIHGVDGSQLVDPLFHLHGYGLGLVRRVGAANTASLLLRGGVMPPVFPWRR